MTSGNSKQEPKGLGILAFLGLLFSISAVLVAAFSGFGTRWGWWDFRGGLSSFKDSVFIGGAGLALSLAALVWALIVKSRAGRAKAIVGLAVGLLIVGNFFAWLHQAQSVPRIHDITTDTENPPLFDDAVLALRKDALNPPEYGGVTIASQQKQAYPDIQPLVLNNTPDLVWKGCLAAAKKMGWDIVGADEPKGRIEATATTLWFGFKDDIVVRVTPQDKGSRVDVRSESRVGLSDVGTNAKRIREYLRQVLGCLQGS